MNTHLLDVAFSFFSSTLTSRNPAAQQLKTNNQRIAELRRRFPDTDTAGLKQAIQQAKQLAKVAIEMAEDSRSAKGTPIDVENLSLRCPGFSDDSYTCAINDGFILTR